MTSFGRYPEYDNDWEFEFEQDERNYLNDLQDSVILNKFHKNKRNKEESQVNESKF